MNGYLGKILEVNLSTGEIVEEELNAEYAKAFFGGGGLAARYIYDLTDANTDPLGPDNPLVLMTGPLVGTRAPSCGRYVICARSPQTGLWGESNVGGFLGPHLRFAGYDGIIVEGQAAEPVYLMIRDRDFKNFGLQPLFHSGTTSGIWGFRSRWLLSILFWPALWQVTGPMNLCTLFRCSAKVERCWSIGCFASSITGL